MASPSTSLREQVRRSLRDESGAVQEVNGGADALVKLESGQWQLLFLDRCLPDLDADEVAKIIRARFPGIEVVLLDSHSDGLPSSFTQNVPRYESWLRPSAAVSSGASSHGSSVPSCEVNPLPGMIGSCAAMLRLYRFTRLVAPRHTTVLIVGDTGTGKELVARAVHQLSPRVNGPWLVVNCAAIPEALLEAELFGFARGAFTGAVQSYAGRILAAQGGTLFLDEIGELPLSLQAKLLRFLEQKEVQRLGSSEALRVDVRVVAATNADLPDRVQQGRFREDLYYRLSAFPLELPPLRERGPDIQLLAEHFLKAATSQSRCGTPILTREAMGVLEKHPWNGNVRELQQAMERAAILSDGCPRILPEHLYFSSLLRERPCAEKSAGSARF